MKLQTVLHAVLASIVVFGGMFLVGCQTSKETIAPDAGRTLTPAEKADEERRAASGKM